MLTFTGAMRAAVIAIVDLRVSDLDFRGQLDLMDGANERYSRETGKAAIDVYDVQRVHRKSGQAQLHLIQEVRLIQ